MRDFDFVQGAHDVLVALAGLASDVTSGLPYTVLGGLVASQAVAPSLTINISAGRIYQFASSDLVGVGSIPQDLNTIVQQGFNPAQSLTLVAPSSGQSQWNLVQAQFSQVDAVRTNDPNGGIVPFYNAANPTQPTLNSINTVRKGVCVLQVVTGSAATTGSEVPPNPTNGWVPLYMIDLAGGQTQITTSQIISCGPSVGTGVSSNYPSAPFLAGLLASHHSGRAGQAPQIKLASEVQGILPYANMSAVRTLLNSNLTVYVATTGSDTNTGLTPSVPFRTLQAAANALYRNYDFNGNIGLISVANGTYTAGVSVTGLPLGSPGGLTITGNTASPGSCPLNVTNGNGFQCTVGSLNCVGFSITATGSSGLGQGFAIYSLDSGVINFGSMVFGTCSSGHLLAQSSGTIQIQSPLGLNYTINGSAPFHMQGSNSGNVNCASSVATLTGSPTFSTAFAVAQQSGNIFASLATYSGGATGNRYTSFMNGTIQTGSGGSATFFPGTVNGTSTTGGQYQ